MFQIFFWPLFSLLRALETLAPPKDSMLFIAYGFCFAVQSTDIICLDKPPYSSKRCYCPKENALFFSLSRHLSWIKLVWTHLDPFGPIWTHLDPSDTIYSSDPNKRACRPYLILTNLPHCTVHCMLLFGPARLFIFLDFCQIFRPNRPNLESLLAHW